MKNQSNIFVITLFILLIISCNTISTKDKYILDFSEFVIEVEKNYSNYTSKEWENIDIEFNTFIDAKIKEHKETLTKEDKKAIGKLAARYSVVRAKGYRKEFREELENAKDYLKGFMEGLSEDTIEVNNH
jgi:hypothetical protein